MTSDLLTPRWTPMLMHPERKRMLTSTATHLVVAAGRRSGKTEDAKREIIMGRRRPCCLRPPDVPNPRFGVFGPTREQLKRNWWDDIKAMCPPWSVADIHEDALSIKFVTGSKLYLIGLDKPQRAEGDPFDGVILDETQEIKPTAWTSSIYPTLTNRGRPMGWSWRIGRPKGRNHFYKWWTEACTLPDQAAFTWTSEVVLPPEQIAAAKDNNDAQSYAQEFLAHWLVFEGLAYYAWDPTKHLRTLSVDPNRPLIFALDFNVEPGTAAVMQEQVHGDTSTTCVVGEVHIKRNSNTPAVCRKLIEQWGKHPGEVHIYGDPAGGARHTSQTDGTDWVVVRELLRPVFGDRMRWRVAKSHPYIRDRVNSVNSRLKSTTGIVRMAVDPQKAPNVVRDFEGVTLLEGGSGEIDKIGCERQGLTHLTEAIGYYIHEKHPLEARFSYVD